MTKPNTSLNGPISRQQPAGIVTRVMAACRLASEARRRAVTFEDFQKAGL